MKIIKALNTIAIGIPIFILLFGIISEGALILSAISTILTGFIQLILGIILLFKFKEKIHYKIYFISVIIFFSLWIWSPT